jgi:ATP-dependent Clp protease ATP-binding subunit ClpA
MSIHLTVAAFLAAWSIWRTKTIFQTSYNAIQQRSGQLPSFVFLTGMTIWVSYVAMALVYTNPQNVASWIYGLMSTSVSATFLDWVRRMMFSSKGFPVSTGNIGGKHFDMESFKKELSSEIIGQDKAIETVVETMAVRLKTRGKSKRPIAVFLAVGPTGVGKTETAKSIAKSMKRLDKRYDLLSIDMSGFYSDFTASFLVGSPPGYIGSDEGGKLTRPMILNPYRVVLFDEIEKAHPSTLNIFLQIFDEGRLVDLSSGETSYFDQSVIFLTSNLASVEIARITENHLLSNVQKERLIKDRLVEGDIQGDHLRSVKPEILGRIDAVLIYRPLLEEHYVHIIARAVRQYLAPGENGLEVAHALYEKYKILSDYGVREIIRKAEHDVILRKK